MEAIMMSTSYWQTAVFYSLIAITTILSGVYVYMENLRIVRFGNKLPGPQTVPILGNALLTLGVHPDHVLEKLEEYDVFGPVVRAFLGKKLVIFLYHPRDVEIILSSTVHIDKSPEYRFFKPWLGDGLLISSGEKWRSHRKIIAPTFHLNVLKTFVPLFYENSRDLVVRLRDQVGKEFDCHDYLSAVTVDILLETAMGLKETEKHKTGYDYAMAVMKMCDIVHRRQYHVNLRFDFLFKFSYFAKQQEKLLDTIHGLTSKVIQKKKADAYKKICLNAGDEQRKRKENAKTNETAENNDSKTEEKDKRGTKMHYVRDDLDDIDDNDIGEKKRLAFLDLMLELAKSGAQLTDEEIKEEVDTIMFEGHDTTAAGSSFVLCALGIHQDIQDRVYEELNEIFKGSNRPCTFQDTLEMKYLERVIFETLRLFPPVPAIARLLKEDVKIATKDYVLPKGCTVVVAPFKVHRLEEFYPNPEVFNPDNFLPERMQSRHYYSFIPFSAGPRSCVGRKYAILKLKVLLSTILRDYRIQSDLTEKDFRLKVDIILKRVDGFRIKIEPRNKSSEEIGA
ncbi:cytochrome P450 4g15-like [Hylaeus anthracinus]|uniref:cytochrome P450 4g15-like n=1 Tax=Hylaeus anthracinus TaxID=313031 RepID=UPI0023B9D9B5|nr:cytochrome P450 4g15-like [Hylaeus anthracinus]XP_054004651.1 cytochrome P450 4g15-like [Hylaeus anthracinus]